MPAVVILWAVLIACMAVGCVVGIACIWVIVHLVWGLSRLVGSVCRWVGR